MKRKSLLKLMIILIFIGISASIVNKPENLSPKCQDVSTIHPKIYINGESALDSFPNKTGSGTQSNPYKISNLEIDAQGSGTAVEINAIFLRYLILDTISVTGSGSNDVSNDCGIKIRNCQNVVIQNCEVYSNDLWGILITLSTRCEITDSGFMDNAWTGIQVDDSSFIEVRDNTLETGNDQYGIGVSGSNNILVSGNFLESTEPNSNGVDLYYSSGNTISQNTIEGYNKGVQFGGSSNNEILKNEISSCQYGVYLEEQSNNNLIKNNKFSNNDENFYEIDSSDNRLINTVNIIVWSSVGGVALVGAVLSIIFLPKVYKKRAPIREKRQQEREEYLKELQKKREEEQKIREQQRLEQHQLMERRRLEHQQLVENQRYQQPHQVHTGVTCQNCHKILPDPNLKFCIYCGLKIAIPEPLPNSQQPSFCSICGKAQPELGLKFCVHCGQEMYIHTEITPTAPPVEEPVAPPEDKPSDTQEEKPEKAIDDKLEEIPEEMSTLQDDTHSRITEDKPVEQAKLKCKNCGKVIDDPSLKFCVYCGTTF